MFLQGAPPELAGSASRAVVVPDSRLSEYVTAWWDNNIYFYLQSKVVDNKFIIEDHILHLYFGTDTVLTIPSSITYINYLAFYHNATVQALRIPVSVESVGVSISNDSRLTDIYYAGTQQQWQSVYSDGALHPRITVHYNAVW